MCLSVCFPLFPRCLMVILSVSLCRSVLEFSFLVSKEFCNFWISGYKLFFSLFV